jgi:hypothetical protein
MDLINVALTALTNPDNYTTYTLPYSDVKKVIAIFVQILVAIIVIGFLFLGHKPGKFGWILSIVNSGVMSLAGILYLYMTIQRPQYEGFYSLAVTDRALIHSYDNASVIITLWFTLASIADFIAGYFLYPDCMDMLTGYIHHVGYVLLLVVGLTGNTYFFGKVTPYSSGFVLALIEEVPTFFLALGKFFNTNWDWYFGISFVTLRIGHHAFLLYYAIMLKAEGIPTGMLLVTWVIHVIWFGIWLRDVRAKNQKEKEMVKMAKKSQ